MSASTPHGLAIDIQGLSKSFGRAAVLRDLDLQVPWGETLAVLGPNGSGKTTLIKILATLTKPDAGKVRVAGGDISRAGKSVRRLIGVVTHDTLLYEGLTAYENLKFFARMFGLDGIEGRIERSIERMGMASRLHDRVSTLSHGMKKRVSIARALLHDPPVLLMDEPESGLDQEALALLDDVVTDRTIPYRTVVMTTHNIERGLQLGSRMAILSRGRIAYQESRDAVAASDIRDTYFQHTGARE
ncbi:MAG: ABC transporter ATP-binding protein [Chloroflexi bacterium]|nr:ABC transporter ATP-binding protein [Chloroflexota bacterium]